MNIKDLKVIQKHLLGYLFYLKKEAIEEPEQKEKTINLEGEIMAVKKSLRKIEEFIKKIESR